VLPYLPTWLLERLLDWLPRGLLAYRMLKCAGRGFEDVLRNCEAMDWCEDEYRQVVHAICAAAARNAMLAAIFVLAGRARASALLRRLVVVRGAEAVRATVAERGAVVACLHSDGLPSLLALHGYTYERAVCVMSPENAGIGLDAAAPMPDMVAHTFGTLV